MKAKGLPIVVSAASGTGKTTLCRHLLEMMPEVDLSVSFTTRPPRPGEVPGRSYHFVSRETFDQMVRENAFAEWAEVHGERYGTSSRVVEEALEAGKSILFDIDVQGGAQLKARFPETVMIFLLPPSIRELERRLTRRGTDSPAVIARRMRNAYGELERSSIYDYLIINEEMARTIEVVMEVLRVEKIRHNRPEDRLRQLMDHLQSYGD